MTRAILLLLFALAVAPARADQAPPPFNQALTEAVLRDAYAALRDRYLEPVRLADLTLAALRTLSSLDAGVAVDRRGDQVRLAIEDRQFAAWRAPSDADAAQWAHLAASVAAAAQGAPGVRRAGQERLLRTMFDAIGTGLDPFTRYVPPHEAHEARGRRQGQGGIGVRVVPAAGGAAVIDVAPDSPAAHAGLVEGDRIYAIDGVRTRGLSETQIAARLAGEEDSRLVLSVRSRGAPRTLTLIRTLIVPETVSQQRRGSLLIMKISGFNELTDQRLSRLVLAAAQDTSLTGLVLDLRGNRGGLLRQAVGVTDVFLAEGEVAATRGRHPDAARVYVAGGSDLAAGLPLVVLVDGRTASAAEIVAAALQERGRAVVLGSVTQGKGLVQTVLRLPDDGEFILSWSRVLVPPGRPLHELGVLPTLCTSRGTDVLALHLAQLRQAVLPLAEPQATLRALRAPPGRNDVARPREACPPADLAQGSAELEAAAQLLADPAALATALGRPPASPRQRNESLAGGN